MARVLVVEDILAESELLGIVLKRAGHEVRTAATAWEAVRAFQQEHPDIAILDIGLPDIDGYEFIRRLRQVDGLGATPVVALTGYAMEGDRRRISESGFDKHLPKPVEPEQLVTAIQEVLSRLKT